MSKKQQAWHLNSSWGEHNLAQTFVAQGFWELDPAKLGDTTSVDRLCKIKNGDLVHLVSYSKNVCMTTEAIGLVTSICHRKMKLLIEWQQKHLRQREFSYGTVRPITGPYEVKTETNKAPSKKTTSTKKHIPTLQPEETQYHAKDI